MSNFGEFGEDLTNIQHFEKDHLKISKTSAHTRYVKFHKYHILGDLFETAVVLSNFHET